MDMLERVIEAVGDFLASVTTVASQKHRMSFTQMDCWIHDTKTTAPKCSFHSLLFFSPRFRSFFAVFLRRHD